MIDQSPSAKATREATKQAERYFNKFVRFCSKKRKRKRKKKGCYIATCVYGSYDCPQVWTLRRYRDEILSTTWYGRAFIRLYYSTSPTLVRIFGHMNWFQNFFRAILDDKILKLHKKGITDTPYQD